VKLPVLFLVAALAAAAAEPVRIVFDTDMGNDIDDAIALAILHALESRGEARLLAVTLTKDTPQAAPFVDAVNTFYGRPGIPIGVVRDGKTPEPRPMLAAVVDNPAFPRRLRDGRDAPEATGLLRRILAGEKDGSVVFVQVGFSTNLARLLASAADAASPLSGRDLVARKARLLSIMAGHFPAGNPEYNVRVDLPASRKVYEEWPTPIVFSGLEVGGAMLFPAASIETEFGYVAQHPVAVAYRAYKKMPYDRPTWDPTSALFAVRPERGYFSLSPPGMVSLDAEGRTTFAPRPDGTHRILTLDPIQRARTLEAMIGLASQPPR
jgi:inosine-uridine nucleoside N-ribohydrolase